MSKPYRNYTQEDTDRVIELLKDNFSDVEIVAVTGYTKYFVNKTTTEYWRGKKVKMQETDTSLTDIEKRKNFNKSFNLPISGTPKLIGPKRFILQHKLMNEELIEYLDACANGDIVEVADALSDMQEILYGMFAEHGMLDLHNPLYDEVHRSNMSKLGLDGKPIYREDGKVIKGPKYHKPNIAKVLGI